MNLWKFSVFLVAFIGYFEVTEAVSFEEDVTITAEEKRAIDKLRYRVSHAIVEDYMNSDIYLIRWLRSANFDIHVAEQRFLRNIKWRKENRMSTIEQEDFSDVAAEFPYYNKGVDKEGRPLFIAFAGDWDIRSAVVTGRARRVLRYLDHGMEMLVRDIRKLQSDGKNVTQAILIITLGQFSLATHGCPQCLMRILDFVFSYENHYPGVADKVFFVDAPPAVHFILEMIKQNASKETRDAIRIYGTNRHQWEKVLQKYIDKKYLPKSLGGSMVMDSDNN